MPPRESWRDVAAAYLVHCGLRLAGRRTRHDIALHMAAELRADVAARMASDLARDLASRGPMTRADAEAALAPCLRDAEQRLAVIRDKRGEVG